MPRDREPWIKVKIGLARSGKIVGLPSGDARFGYVVLLLESKVQRVLGEYDSRAHVAGVLGKYARFIDAYLTADLIHEAPSVCPDCKARHPGLKRGQIVVHDYAKEQRDPTHADRQAGYRGKVRDGDSDALGTPQTVPNEPDRDAADRTDPVTNGDVRDGDSDALGTADSRARGTTATATVTTKDSQDRESENGRVAVAPAGGRRKSGAGDPVEEPEWMR
jgi:hypothetical protein